MDDNSSDTTSDDKQITPVASVKIDTNDDDVLKKGENQSDINCNNSSSYYTNKLYDNNIIQPITRYGNTLRMKRYSYLN